MSKKGENGNVRRRRQVGKEREGSGDGGAEKRLKLRSLVGWGTRNGSNPPLVVGNPSLFWG